MHIQGGAQALAESKWKETGSLATSPGLAGVLRELLHSQTCLCRGLPRTLDCMRKPVKTMLQG